MGFNRNRYKRSWIRALRRYEREAFLIMQSFFRSQARKVPYVFLNEENYKETIKNAIRIGGLYDAYFQVYLTIGLAHGNRVGNEINRELKDFNPVMWETEFRRLLYQWVLENVGYRIVSVHSDFIKYIQVLVADSFKNGLPPRELAKEIEKLIGRRDFYRWQGLRIARTEAMSAANRATISASRSSDIAWQKEWISVVDSRTRRNPQSPFDHVEMDGVTVPENEYFNVNGEFIEHPGAIYTREGNRSSAANVINCRCSVAVIPMRDSQGRIIRQREDTLTF